MSYLLVTQDERELVAFLCEELGARLLLSDVAPGCEPQIAKDPLAALPVELPDRPTYGVDQINNLIFWLPDCGPIKTLHDAPASSDPRDRVAKALTKQTAGERFPDVIDRERTPLLTLLRSHKHGPNRLAPGNLGSMPLNAKLVPEKVKLTVAKAQRWLRARGLKVDPFDHCPEVQTQRPRRLGPLWVWVQPHAKKVVAQGTEIWPWNR